MRPRKKNNLGARLEACAPVILSPQSVGEYSMLFAQQNAPLHLELGCGKGQFICELAQRHPTFCFAALEREENVAVLAAERAMSLGAPQNLRFLLEDAERLPELFSPGSVSRIYINFCDPWHKRRQFKRRLTWREKLAVYRTLLTPEGELHFKTDNEPLYRFSLREFSTAMPYYFCTEDLHHSKYAAENVLTEYETHFSSLGQPIYAIRAKNS